MGITRYALALLTAGCVLPNPAFDEPSQSATATVGESLSGSSSATVSTVSTGATTTEPTSTTAGEPTEPTTTGPTSGSASTGETSSSSTGSDACWELGTCQAEAEWVLHYPRTVANERVLLAPFKDGSIAAVGRFVDQIELGEIEVKSGQSEAIYVARISPSGDVLWLLAFAGTELNHAIDVAVDGDDRIYLAGAYHDKLDFGDGGLSGGLYAEAFYAVLNGDGSYALAKGFSGDLNQYATAIRPHGGGVVFAGHYDGELDLGAGPLPKPTENKWNLFIAKHSAKGELLWSFDAGEMNTRAVVNKLDVDAEGSIYAVGSFSGMMEFAGAQTAIGISDGFVAKVDGDGNPVWFRRIGSEGRAQGLSAVEVDAQGNVWIAGSCGGAIDVGGVALVCNAESDGLVAALDGDGAGLWAQRFGTSGYDVGTALATRDGRGLMLGVFAQAAEIDDDMHVALGIQDHLLVELDGLSGAYLWSQASGGENPMGQYESADDIVAVGPQALVLSAAFYSEINFGSDSPAILGGLHSAIIKAAY